MQLNKSLLNQFFPWLIVAISLILLTFSFTLFVFYQESAGDAQVLVPNNILYLILASILFFLFVILYLITGKYNQNKRYLNNKAEVILNSIQDAVFYLSPEGTILDVNEYAICLIRLDREEILGRHINDIYCPKKDGNILSISFIKEKVSHRHNLIFQLTDSDQFIQVQDSLSSVFDNHNRVSAYVLNIQDVSLIETSRHRIEQEKSRYRAIFDSAIEGIITFSDIGIISRCNSALLKSFRYDKDEVIGKDVQFLFFSDSKNIFTKVESQSFEDQIAPFIGTQMELKGQRKNKRPLYVSLSIADTGISGERRFSAIIRDISKEKNLQEQMQIQTQFLSDEEKRYAAIFDTAADAIITISEHGLISSFNKAAETIFQYSHKEVFGKNIKMLMSVSDAKHHDHYIANYHRTNIKGIIGNAREVKGRRKDGTEVPLMLSVADTGVKGEKRFSGILRNITAQKFSDRMLKQAVKIAESALSAKSNFLDTMSHEIRTPLNSVLGMGELLEKTTLTVEQRAYIQGINNSGSQLLALINDILDYSKLDANMVKLETTEFDLEKICVECLSALTGHSHLQRVELLLDYDLNCPRLLIGDSVRVTQIINNLLSNAFKFTEKGFIRLKVNQSDRNIKLSVQDTGIGISEKAQEKLFNEFMQADESTTREYGGTGLGLAITRKFVQLMKGEINYTSLVDIGTEFIVTIPLKVADSQTDIPKNELSFLSKYKIGLLSHNKRYFEILSHIFNCLDVQLTYYSCFDEIQNQHTLYSEEITSDKECKILLLIDNNLSENNLTTINNYYNHVSFNVPEIILLSNVSQLNIYTQHKYQNIKACLNKLVTNADFIHEIVKFLQSKNNSHLLGFANRIELESLTQDMRFSKAHVLVVDDIISNQYVTSQFLEKYDIQVSRADNGQKAVEQFIKHQYDLVFMDCRMPVMDGYEATQKIREYEKKNNIDRTPIVAMTANSGVNVHLKCKDAGMDDFLLKPMKQSLLEKSLEIHLASFKEIIHVKNISRSNHETNISRENISHDNLQDELDSNFEIDVCDCIDRQTYDQLIADMGESHSKIINLIFHNLSEIFEKLSAIDENTPHKDILISVHSLCSPAANIGANNLKQKAINLENSIESDPLLDLKVIQSNIEELKTEFSLVTRCIKKLTN